MDEAIPRRAARILVIDGERVLLFRCTSANRPQDGPWWITPGGGLEGTEDARWGAVRELTEETGLVVEPTEFRGPVFEEEIEYPTSTGPQRQRQQYFVLFHPAFEVDRQFQTDWERRFMGEARWWNSAELRESGETVYPPNLADLLDQVIVPTDGLLAKED
ncbi:NUDIX hydrolase [Cryptosporangium aurantiacum]|uniref:ADP-ribose pyrophosphatase YjhB, NUDIX family n=1 Tax=Cryptosporangium aurantiacum TaxID=134849 RepID=A0A1M7HW80_9ACTN|nr:NUDIX domain-containing protein [Cryptosporangium aurantiacum]SHM32831.1 ADP-ribose pyrophosphatase YjhB, NUDIX family [Cryptosporangium aurantiacum]